jgi:acyl CoA:acetate/3-ketoacid CoA transferase alpha subunit
VTASAARSGRLTRLADAVRTHVRPGMHLHFASTPSRSNAGVRELARAFYGTRPRFTLSSTGFHSLLHLLPMLQLGETLAGCFFGDHYPAPRPNALYTRAAAAGVQLQQWSLWSLVSSLRAGALGDGWAVNRTLAGTSIAADLAAAGAYREVADLGDPRPLGLCAAMRPDVTFVHAAVGDDDGNVLLSAPYSEGLWSALAAKRGVIVTVERLAPCAWSREYPDLIALPADRVLAVCVEPFGAHPQSFHCEPDLGIASYRDDFDGYDLWRTLTTDEAAAGRVVERILAGDDGGESYRAMVGGARLAKLCVPRARRGYRRTWTPVPPTSPSQSASIAQAAPLRLVAPPKPPRTRAVASAVASAVDRMIVAGARQLAARARAIDARVLIAGIGHAFFASRLAQLALAAEGFELQVMVEIGLYGVACGPEGSGYPLAYDNVRHARRLSSIDDVLGVLSCGADNRCLAALGAAQIDPSGNLNSTRLADGRLLVGSGGACDIAAGAAEVVVLTRLAPGRLVAQLDYRTSPGRAVRSVVTDRGVLTRGARGWQLASLWADEGGTTVTDAAARVVADCAWPLTLAPDLALAAPISDDEAQRLGTLDPDGSFRGRAA